MSERIFICALASVIITLICSVTYYNYSELKSLERNVESAIVKGIDPLAVRCAYAKNNDTICVAYGTTKAK
ncbi:hypothetical protein UFOVP240_1 [uncultured Caudovirales phage]|uniref:Uncharacterized protein n=1 Tax=uncultured Caudovirales phage TaxID=2100421 RepID=A0A6J7WUN5_9CAUD|nr:hypothetical protein UFOVP240_1 [uncultured Caudovirales phage]